MVLTRGAEVMVGGGDTAIPSMCVGKRGTTGSPALGGGCGGLPRGFPKLVVH